MRLNKYLANIGLGSRREIDKQIAAGNFYVNGKLAQPGLILEKGDEILEKKANKCYKFTDDNAIKNRVYIALNKPEGIECSCDTELDGNIISFLKEQAVPKDFDQERLDFVLAQRLVPVGRLDKNSCGLILLTNDGDLTYKLTHPSFEHEKEYEVQTEKDLPPGFIEKFCAGVKIKDDKGKEVKTLKCQAKKIKANAFSCILTQGYKRQIRQMVLVLGSRVKTLKRIRIQKLNLASLKEAQFYEVKYQDIFANEA